MSKSNCENIRSKPFYLF